MTMRIIIQLSFFYGGQALNKIDFYFLIVWLGTCKSIKNKVIMATKIKWSFNVSKLDMMIYRRKSSNKIVSQ